MALIKCEECGAKISDKAGACPHCGNPKQPMGSNFVITGEYAYFSVGNILYRRPIRGSYPTEVFINGSD